MINLIFVITIAAEILAAGSVAYSLIFPNRKIWPPPQKRSWQALSMWLFFIVSGLGVVLLGILDWGSTTFPWWIRWPVGIPLWLAGNGLALWAMITLGLAPTFGSEGKLISRGPYRFSRNPQYVGFIAGLIGWGFLANSALTLLAAVVGSIALILAPFAEEPWLQKMYGSAYDQYKLSVPRFIGLKK